MECDVRTHLFHRHLRALLAQSANPPEVPENRLGVVMGAYQIEIACLSTRGYWWNRTSGSRRRSDLVQPSDPWSEWLVPRRFRKFRVNLLGTGSNADGDIKESGKHPRRNFPGYGGTLAQITRSYGVIHARQGPPVEYFRENLEAKTSNSGAIFGDSTVPQARALMSQFLYSAYFFMRWRNDR